MNESGRFQIGLSENFERTQEKLFRERYRKNRLGLEKFVELIEKIIKGLSIDPRPRPPAGHLEPFPKGSSREGYELWKLEFNMPQLRGAAKQGRLIYLLNVPQQKVILLWIYTHAEFEKRPPDRDLKRLLLELIKSEPVVERSNEVEIQEKETVKEEEPQEPKSDE